MAMVAHVVLALSWIPRALGSPLELSQEFESALQADSGPRIESLFANPAQYREFSAMAQRRGGWRNLHAVAFPAPPKWDKPGAVWITAYTFHDIEEDRDPVYVAQKVGDTWKIGTEIPEFRTENNRIQHADIQVRIEAPQHRFIAQTDLKMGRSGQATPLFRLSHYLNIVRAVFDDKRCDVVMASLSEMVTPKNGDVLRAGGLLIPWSNQSFGKYHFQYSGEVNRTTEDAVNEKSAILAAWWTPTVGRLPFTTRTRILAPDQWIIKCEGLPSYYDKQLDKEWISQPGEKEWNFECKIPISFPKVIGGKYILAAELKDGDKTYRAYHFDDKDKTRAENDVKTMREAVRFFEEKLGPFPFPGYDVFDADSYYGIESYSYTLLNKRITSQFVAHEIGHTYFGGLAPCAYVEDSWNEGVTQYVDSVVRQNNSDRTLESAIRTMQIATPLSRMFVPHAWGGASYWRGAYAMRMLQEEIGLDKVFSALKRIVRERQGKSTRWSDLRPYFEKSSGKALDWFWRQWIDGYQFPKIEIMDAQCTERDGRFTTLIFLSQSGPSYPFRMRFKISVSNTEKRLEKDVLLTNTNQTFRVDTDFEPKEAKVIVFPTALATTGPSKPIHAQSSIQWAN